MRLWRERRRYYMADYSVLVQAVLQRADIQKQLNDLQKNIKPITLSVKANATDVEKLNITIGKMQNQLEGLSIRNKDAFKNPEVQAMAGNVKNLITNLDGSTNATGRAQVAMGQLRNRVAAANEEFRLTSASTDNFSTALGKAIGKIAMWAVATTAIYGSLRQLEQGVQYVKDLNKELTNTQIVTGYSDNQIKSLASDYNNLATELGATTLEVAKGALEWQRQGKSVEETKELLRASVMMAKLANMDQAQSTEYLTSIINGYKLSLDEVMPTIDALVALDNNYASSVGIKNFAEICGDT